MITFIVLNRYTYIKGDSLTQSIIRHIERATSYRVAGFMFAPSYRAKRWDGKEHLMKYVSGKTENGYRLPTGLLEDVLALLDELGVEYQLDQSQRRRHIERIDYKWNDSIVLRPYQTQAVKTMVAPHPWNRCCGILKMPIRSGKTKTMAAIIRLMKARALFIVPSRMLLHQTKLALEEALLRPIGIIGDSEWQLEDVTVACVSSLASKRGGEKIIKGKDGGKDKKVTIPPDPRYKTLRTMFDLVVFDEVHHLKGDKWHDVYMDFDAPYRIGLSATVYFDNESESERGVIWLKACCGGIKVDVPTSLLIEQGYLMRQNIILHTVDQPDLRDRKWSKTLQNLAIYENTHRNDKICQLAKQQCDEGTKVLIISNRLNQVEYIRQRLVDMGINAKCITGDDKTIDRKDMVLDYVTGDVPVLVGTVFGEGVDIPEVECVINAEGGKDVKAAVQRMRNLTPHDGKTKALFHDFIDTTNPYFAKHSLERIRTYRSEPAFNICVADDV